MPANSAAEQDLWYKNAIIYGIDIRAFQDSNGDGWGDFQGAIRRLDYLSELGVTCLWLLPFVRSPFRDNGYDIMDYFDVDPAVGTLADFEEFLHLAGERGMRVIVDLVMNHTSDRHPWFEAARRDRRSRYYQYYVWTDVPPPVPPDKGTIFPGEENSVWTFDEIARQYYHHRFYHFEPGLQGANPEVIEEIKRVMDFWLSFDIAGFRLDAASHLIEDKLLESASPTDSHGILKDLRSFVDERRPSTALIGESDVDPEHLADFFGSGDELHLLFNFLLNNYLMLALARGEAEPIRDVLLQLPSVSEVGQWANFLRNLDEVDLERLTDEAREEVYNALAPDPDMRIYGRGIRRRLAPMLGGDQRRLKMMYSLLFSLPGSPVVVYGDEIGMGEDLSQDARNSVRAPMQWSDEENGGFSTAPAEELIRPVISGGDFGYESLNVDAQRADPESLLTWFKRLIRVRRESPEMGWGRWHLFPPEAKSVLAHRMEWEGRSIIAIHNLADDAVEVTLDVSGQAVGNLIDLLGEGGETRPRDDGTLTVELEPYGYRWYRVRTRERTV